ncbi:MAG: TonB-dependent receptor plug domain-containing protein, partial [Saprospiraceae bacterium]
PGYQVSTAFRYLDCNFFAHDPICDRGVIRGAALMGPNWFYATILNKDIQTKQVDSLDLQNNGLRLRWRQQWNPSLATEILAINSDFSYDYQYAFKVAPRSQDNRIGVKNNQICEKQLQLNNTYLTANKQQIRTGYHLQHYSVESRITTQNRNNSPSDQRRDNIMLVHSLYADFNTDPKQKWGVEAGIRLNYLQRSLPANNQQKNSFLEPRLRLWYQPTEHLQLYGNAGKYFQFLNQIIEFDGDEASIEMPVWVLGGAKDLPFLNATQYQVGAVWQQKSLLIDVQLYQKNIDGLTSRASNFDEFVASRFLEGNANIRGVDVLIKKRWGQFRSWWSYSYSDIEHRFQDFFDPIFPALTEQPHQFHWVNTYKIGQFDLSLGWKIASGTPYSNRDYFRIERRMSMDGQENLSQLQPIENQFNSERLPAQHQLDLSVNYTYQAQRCKAVFGLSLFNVYNQENIYSRSFFIGQRSSNQQGPPRLELRYLDRANLGFTPNAVVRLEW